MSSNVANEMKRVDTELPFRTASKFLIFSVILLFSGQEATAQTNTSCPTNGDCEVSFDIETTHRELNIWEVTENDGNQIQRVPLNVGSQADGTVEFQLRKIQTDKTRGPGIPTAEIEKTKQQQEEKIDPERTPHSMVGDIQLWWNFDKSAVDLTIRNGKVTGRGLNDKGQIGILIINDDKVEPSEFFDIVLTNPTGNITFPGGATELIQRVEIKENSTGLKLQVNSSTKNFSTNVVEGESAKFILSLSRELEAGEYAHIYVYTDTERQIEAPDTPASPADYGRILNKDRQLITWGPGQKDRTIFIPTTDDDIDEVDEKFVFSLLPGLTSGVNTHFHTINPHFHVTIEDNDPTPVISVPSVSVLEGNPGEEEGIPCKDNDPCNKNPKMVFEVKLDRPRDKNLTVDYEIVNGTAKAREDYDKPKPPKGMLTFSPGEVEKIVTVDVKRDNINEPNETVFLRLTNPQNATFDTGGNLLDGVGTIVNDDKPIVLTLRLLTSPVVEGEQAIVRAEIDRKWSDDIDLTWSINYSFSTPGVDFSIPSEVTCKYPPAAQCKSVIKAGKTFVDLKVNILEDNEDNERLETLTFVVTPDSSSKPTWEVVPAYTRNIAQFVVTILDGNAVFVRDAVAVVTEGADVVFPIELNVPAASDVTITWHTEDGSATDGVATGNNAELKDYEPKSSEELIIPAGQKTAYARVETVQDDIDEDRETFSLVVTSADGVGIYDDRATGTIRDDDARPEISISDAPAVTEGGTSIFTVSLKEKSDRPVSMRWQTADGNGTNPATVNDRDYKLITKQTLTIPAGDLTATIEVPTYNDGDAEYEETFRVLLSHAPAGMIKDGEGIGTIEDDDLPKIFVSRVLEYKRLSNGVDRTVLKELENGTIPESWPSTSGSQPVYFDFELSAPVLHEVKAKFKMLNGNKFGLRAANPNKHGVSPKQLAEPGDYLPPLDFDLIFKPGDTSVRKDVVVYNDTRVENDEVFRVQITEATGAIIDMTRDTGEVTIEDDDGITYYVPSDAPTEVKEGESLTISFKRRPPDVSNLYTTWPENFRTKFFTEHFRVCLFGGVVDYVNYQEKKERGRANVSGGIIKVNEDVRLTQSAHGGEGNHCRIYSDSGTTNFVIMGFNINTSEGTAKISTIQDNLIEGDETVTLQFEIMSRYNNRDFRTPQSDIVRHEITIIDDDAHRIKVGNKEAVEGEPIIFEVEVDTKDPKPAPGTEATVYYTTVDGTAKNLKDYYAVTTPKKITLKAPENPSDPWGKIEIETIQDDPNSESESKEWFTLKLSNPSHSFELDRTTKGLATGKIEDDDHLFVEFIDSVVREGFPAVVMARMSRAIKQDTTVTWSTTSQDINHKAEAGTDYTAVSGGTLKIVKGTTTGTVEITTLDDELDEFDEDFRVRIDSVLPTDILSYDPKKGEKKDTAGAVVAIRDDDPGSVSYGAETMNTTEENQKWVQVPTKLPSYPFGHVNWTKKGGADAGLFNIDADTGELTLPAKNFEVPEDADKDNIYEVLVRAVDEDGNDFETAQPVKVKVTDVNTVEVKLPAPDSVTEGETVSISVERAETDKSAAATVKWETLEDTTEGATTATEDDYTVASEAQPLTLENALTTAFKINATDDDVAEPNETFRFRLFDLSDGVTDDAVFVDDEGTVVTEHEVVLTITDNDKRGVTVSETELSLDEVDNSDTSETEEHKGTYTVVLESKPTGDVSISIKSADESVATVSPVTLEFTPEDWNAAQTVTVTAVDDAIDNENGARTTQITHELTENDTDYKDETIVGIDVTVNDNDAAQVSIADADPVEEGDDPETTVDMTFTVSLDQLSDNDVTVPFTITGTATEAEDYTAPSDLSVEITKGTQSADIVVPVKGDTKDEDNETIVVTLGEAINADVDSENAEATGTITDDDDTPTGVTLSVDTETIVESADAKSVEVTATVNGSTTYSEPKTITISIGAGDSTATSAEDYTAVEDFTLVVPAGISSVAKSFDLEPLNDDLDEDDESIEVTGKEETDQEEGGIKVTGTSITMTDDDTRGVTVTGGPLEVKEVDDSGAEGKREDQAQYKVVLTSQPTADVSISLEVSPAAVTLSSAKLTFTPLNWNEAQTVTVTAENDDIDNADDERQATVTHTLEAGDSDYADVNVDSVNVTVLDDDDAPVISVDSLSVTEGAKDTTTTLTFKVSLSAQSGQAVTVDYAEHIGGTATQGEDYEALTSDTMSFEAGQQEKTISITVKGDDMDEADETVFVLLSSPTNATFENNAKNPIQATGTITDDDETPTVTVSDADAVTEGDDAKNSAPMRFKVLLSAVSGQAVTVPYTLAGTASEGDDYEQVAKKELSIAAGSQSAEILIEVKGDVTDEADETVEVELGTPTNATVSGVDGAGTASGIITDDDATPTVSLALGSDKGTIVESGAGNSTTVTASLSATTYEAVTLTVSVPDGAPVSRQGATLTIAAGETQSTGTVTLSAVNNEVDAVDQQVSVSAESSGANVANPSDVTLTITDDDTRGVTVTGGPLEVKESDDSDTENKREDQAQYTVVLTSEPTDEVTISLSVSPAAVTLSNTKLTFTSSNWNQAQTVTVTAVDDTIDNDNDKREATVTHNLAAGSSDYTGVTVSDVKVAVNDDDDAPGGITLSVDKTSIAEDAKTATVTVTATVDGTTTYANAQTVTVTVGSKDDSATEVDDYAEVDDFDIVINAGSTSASNTFTLDPVNDALDEIDETLSVDGESGSLTIDGTSVEITDDDDAPVISVDSPSVLEGAKETTATLTFKASLSAPSGQAVTVAYSEHTSGTATKGEDYDALTAGTLSFSEGDTEKTITITVKGDDIDEANETVVIRLSLPNNATLSGGAQTLDTSGTITDDDATPTVNIALDKEQINESGSGNSTTVTASLSAVTYQMVTLTVSVPEGSPVDQQNATLTIAAGQKQSTGTVTLNAVNNDVAAGNKTVVVSATAAGSGVPNPSDVTLTIIDDDSHGVKVTGTSLAVFEADDTGTPNTREDQAQYTVVLTSEPTDDVIISPSVSLAAVTLSSTNLTFTPSNWNQEQTVTVTAVDDTIDNDDNKREATVTHTLNAGSSDYTGVTVSEVAVTVNDDDDPPSGITLSVDKTSIAEDAETATVTVTATVDGTTTYASTQTVTVTVGDKDDSATEGADYANVAGFDIVIGAGSTSASKSFSLDPEDDVLDEVTESLSIEGKSGSLKIGSASIDITDNDATTVTLEASNSAISENGGTKIITVTLGRALDGGETISVPLTFGGTATFGTDYTLAQPKTAPTGVSYTDLQSTDLAASPPTISFSGVSSAAKSATVTLTAKEDILDEGESESVSVSLGTLVVRNLDGGASGSGTSRFNITDNHIECVARRSERRC